MRSEDGGAGWEERALYGLANYQNGRAFRPDDVGDEGLPVIKIAELNRGITDATKHFDSESESKHLIDNGDLLFAWSGSPGIYRYPGPRGVLNQHIFKVVATDGIDQGFLRWLLEAQMPVFQRVVADQATTMGHVKVADLKRLRVAVPAPDEQRRIAWVLGSLDDKIELNRRIAETLEQIAAAIFKARFVDFVGVEEFEESELGPIPKGWAVGGLDEVAEFVNGGAFTKLANGAGRPILRIKELNGGLSDATPATDHEVKDSQMARHFDLLFSWSGSLDVYRWDGPESLINQHIFKVIPKDGYSTWFAEQSLRLHLPEFRQIAQDKATTMGHIKRHHLSDAKVALPPGRVQAEVDEEIRPLLDRQSSALAESRTLTALRDALLPKLISGELRVPEGVGPDLDPEVANPGGAGDAAAGADWAGESGAREDPAGEAAAAAT